MPRGGKREGAGRKPALPDFWCDWLVEQVDNLSRELATQVTLDKKTLDWHREVYNPSTQAKTKRLHLPTHLQGLGYEPPEVPVLPRNLDDEEIIDETRFAIWGLGHRKGLPPEDEDVFEQRDDAEDDNLAVKDPPATVRLRQIEVKAVGGYMPTIYDRVAHVFNVFHANSGSEVRLTGKQVDQICKETRRRKRRGGAGRT